jgi:hypothetical protein
LDAVFFLDSFFSFLVPAFLVVDLIRLSFPMYFPSEPNAYFFNQMSR